ncbi:MAG: 50S ribosome-binding GTPase [Candidatus Shikimatogenerans sp. JK-2022]|nr:50S ribosome-binding GTPase [Candidatus Shikimatogenerans bostrichidophilus]
MFFNNFINKLNIICQTGNGGNGYVHFNKKKKKTLGKPDGGNGGNGGNIIIKGDKKLSNFYHLFINKKKKIKAFSGEIGKNNCKTGKNGKNITIKVPLNTKIEFKIKKNKKKKIIKKNNEKIIFLGGKGGKGNNFFKSSKDQKTKKFTKGCKGNKIFVKLKLNLNIDIGLIGYPNTGKTTVFSFLTNTKPKIENYNFTTIIPNIGFYYLNYKKFSIMDTPGIIENSYYGKGLGSKYLKYLKKTKILLIIMNIENFLNFKKKFFIILKEIKKIKIKEKKKIIILSKYENFKKNKIKLIKFFFYKQKISYCFFSIFNEFKKNFKILKKKINKILLKN